MIITLEATIQATTRHDRDLARKLSGDFSEITRTYDAETESFEIVFPRGEKLVVPKAALTLFGTILEMLASGHPIHITPSDTEISTQKAAELLNVSRPYLVKLLERGEIPFRKVGSHRRLRIVDVEDYRKKSDQERDDAFQEMIGLSEDLGIGYE